MLQLGEEYMEKATLDIEKLKNDLEKLLSYRFPWSSYDRKISK